jgi:predicted signal transduction protein with EAL and GGDEF domain
MRHAAITVLVMGALAAIFAAYLRPNFVIDLANRIVLCF